MVNLIWLVLVAAGVVVAAAQGNPQAISQTVAVSTKGAVELAIDLAGIMAFWTGIMRIAERSGMVAALARVLAPVVQLVFPEVPRDHPAMGSMLMNISANLLGVGGAATPFGLRAMRELQQLNPRPDTATPSMCTFLAINTTSITLVPTTVIALRTMTKSSNPTEIVVTTILATLCSTVVALTLDRFFRRRQRLKRVET